MLTTQSFPQVWGGGLQSFFFLFLLLFFLFSRLPGYTLEGAIFAICSGNVLAPVCPAICY